MNAEDWNRRYAASESLWSAGPNGFVARELADVAPGRALDVAAGEGRHALWLAERGWRVRAVDFSSVALDRGRLLAQERGVDVAWERADLRRWTPSAESYDLVLVAYLHLPWPEMRSVLRAAADAVAAGGHFILVGHDETNLQGGVGGPADPSVLYGPEAVAAGLSGFEVEKATRLRRPVGDAHAIDCLVRAIRRCAV